MGEFIEEHRRRSNRAPFGGAAIAADRGPQAADRESIIADLFPYFRGAVSTNRRVIGHVDSSEDALTFANSTG